jgi:transcriptional regulator with XRE-family HTH domain
MQPNPTAPALEKVIPMPPRVGNPKNRGKHYIKEWRLFRGLTQQKLADRLDTTKANISRIEAMKQNYTQDFLEVCADALGVDPGTLIMRDPTDRNAPWSLWDQAKPGVRKQAMRVLQGGRKAAG